VGSSPEGEEMRTVQAFVSDMLARGKTPEHIRHVAQCTRWVDKLEEVEQEISRQTQKAA
jgi:hypothetical protein